MVDHRTVLAGDGEDDIAEVLKEMLTSNYHSGSGTHNRGTIPGAWGNEHHTYGRWRKGNLSEVYGSTTSGPGSNKKTQVPVSAAFRLGAGGLAVGVPRPAPSGPLRWIK